jgi:hypothetical protein
MRYPVAFLFVLAVPTLLTGCGSARHAAIIGGGGAVGALGGALYGKHKADEGGRDRTPLYAVGGAAGGALLAGLAAGKDKAAVEEGYRAGYEQAQSDAAKRQYWLRQDAERGGEGRTNYYSLPTSEPEDDGVRRVPHRMVIPIVE